MEKMACFVFPSQLIQLSKVKFNKAANCSAQNHHDITACFQEGFSNFSLSSWREAAPHTILIFWGQRVPYPASSYTAIVNILLDRWEVPLTPLTVTVHGDLYRRHQSQCYVQRSPPHKNTHCPTPWPIHSCWDSRKMRLPRNVGAKGDTFYSGVSGGKTAMLHRCGEVRLGVHVLTHSENRHRACIWDNLPAKLHVNIWRIQLMKMDCYRVLKHPTKGTYVVVKLYEERCTAQLILAGETHGINSTNIGCPAGGDPHVVTSLTNGWDGPSMRRGSDVNRPPPWMVQTIVAPMWWWVPNDL